MNQYDNDSFRKLVEEILDETWKTYPTMATQAGIHEYDDQLDHVDSAAQNAFIKNNRKWLNELAEFEREGKLASDTLIDLKVLRANIEKDIATGTLFNRLITDPSIYPGTAIFGCLIFIMRDFLPKDERYRLLTMRLRDIPRYLSEAKDNLRGADSIPGIWLDMARKMISDGQQFFTHLITGTAEEIKSLKNDILSSATLAARAFDDYYAFLNTELARKPEGSFASGREYFDILLKEYHLLPYDADDLEEIGLEYIEKIGREMKLVAAEIDPGKSPEELIAAIKSETPSPEELLSQYRKEIIRTRRFVIEQNLVTIPDGESLEVIETPLSERATLPYAAYMPPAPFEKEQRGFFWVTPITGEAPEKRRKEQLAGHSRAAIEIRTLHEGYPGHHLQLCTANRLPSKVRQLFGTAVFVEGWALYCEELMKRAGYYSGKKTELIQLKDQLWRACRVVIDARLHTGKCSFKDAVDMLVDISCLERYNAEAEVRRYSQTPTQPMSYLIGKIEIERLLGDCRKKYPDLPVKELHNRLLSYGSIPISLIREDMLGTN
jgi:uncharacterized protein (DUF885 family)